MTQVYTEQNTVRRTQCICIVITPFIITLYSVLYTLYCSANDKLQIADMYMNTEHMLYCTYLCLSVFLFILNDKLRRKRIYLLSTYHSKFKVNFIYELTKYHTIVAQTKYRKQKTSKIF